jgi:pyrophosphatase PpaX
MIKAVLFDVDGVLLDSFEAGLLFYSDIMKFLGKEPFTRESFKPFFHHPFRRTLQMIAGPLTEEELDVLAAQITEHVSYHFELVTTMPGVHETLEILKKKGYMLGIVSSRRNKQTKYLIPELEALKTVFDAHIFYEDVKNHKPHPEPLLVIAERLSVAPNECVYIGDADTDMHAAEAAGMYMITFADEVKGNATIATQAFHELPDLIEKL